MPIDDRPTIAAPDNDPYLWLEEIEGERALDFVEQQSKRTLERFGNAGFADDRDALAAIYDRPDNIPYVSRRGGLLYNFWKDANNPRGIWRRTTLDEFRGPNPKWDILLDLDRLAAEEAEDWIRAAAVAGVDEPAQVLVILRRPRPEYGVRLVDQQRWRALRVAHLAEQRRRRGVDGAQRPGHQQFQDFQQPRLPTSPLRG
jgi:Serine proteases of the peptidase family S9A